MHSLMELLKGQFKFCRNLADCHEMANSVVKSEDVTFCHGTVFVSCKFCDSNDKTYEKNLLHR